jgi:hypothetical protein
MQLEFWGTLILQSSGLIPADCLKILNRAALRGKSNLGTCDDMQEEHMCQGLALWLVGQIEVADMIFK